MDELEALEDDEEELEDELLELEDEEDEELLDELLELVELLEDELEELLEDDEEELLLELDDDELLLEEEELGGPFGNAPVWTISRYPTARPRSVKAPKSGKNGSTVARSSTTSGSFRSTSRIV